MFEADAEWVRRLLSDDRLLAGESLREDERATLLRAAGRQKGPDR
ncbi:hypothetical protein ACFWBN_08925 [Streptomyces sp. NPDC059989]